ncbi:hypothetical protein [Streptomyces tritici]|uniref:hypothetical protein n=1 Tax=Streptomyces tritici TaxID=2054410 RepID=UPI003AF0F6E1
MTTTPPPPAARPEVQVVCVDAVGADQLAVIVRCLATTRLGTRFRCTGRDGRAVDLVLTEIRRYREVTVDEVDPPHGARLLLSGARAGDVHVERGDLLRGTDPAI